MTEDLPPVFHALAKKLKEDDLRRPENSITAEEFRYLLMREDGTIPVVDTARKRLEGMVGEKVITRKKIGHKIYYIADETTFAKVGLDSGQAVAGQEAPEEAREGPLGVCGRGRGDPLRRQA